MDEFSAKGTTAPGPQPRNDNAEICPKIKYLSVAHLFAEAIERIYEERSVSKLWC